MVRVYGRRLGVAGSERAMIAKRRIEKAGARDVPEERGRGEDVVDLDRPALVEGAEARGRRYPTGAVDEGPFAVAAQDAQDERLGYVIEVAGHRDPRARIRRENVVDESAKVEGLRRAPHHAPERSFGASARVLRLDLGARRVAERHGQRRFEMSDEDIDRAHLRGEDARVHDRPPERDPGAEGGRIVLAEDGKGQRIGRMNARGKNCDPGEKRAADAPGVGSADDHLAVRAERPPAFGGSPAPRPGADFLKGDDIGVAVVKEATKDVKPLGQERTLGFVAWLEETLHVERGE